MTFAHNACANCLHFDGDTETSIRYIGGRWREVYLHRCRLHPEREDAGAVYEACFVSRAAADFKARGFDKLVARTDGLTQGELF